LPRSETDKASSLTGVLELIETDESYQPAGGGFTDADDGINNFATSLQHWISVDDFFDELAQASFLDFKLGNMFFDVDPYRCQPRGDFFPVQYFRRFEQFELPSRAIAVARV